MFDFFCFNDKEAVNLSPFEAYTDLMLKRILFIFLTIMVCGSAAAQEFDETLTLYFRHGNGDYDRNYRSNGVIADEFIDKISIMQNLPDVKVTQIITEGSTSPEGGVEFNRKLADKRRQSFKKELHKHLDYPDYKIAVNPDPDCWKGVIELIKDDPYILRKQEVIDIIKEGGSDMTTRLAAFDEGFTLRYIEQALFPQLRTFKMKVTFDMSAYVTPAQIPDDDEIAQTLGSQEDGLDFVQFIWAEQVPFLKVEKYRGQKYTVIEEDTPKKYARKMRRQRARMEREVLKAEKNHVYEHLDYTSEYPVDINDVQYDYTPSVSYSKTVEKPAEITVTPVPVYKPAVQTEKVKPEPKPVVQPEPVPAPVVKEKPVQKPQKEEKVKAEKPVRTRVNDGSERLMSVKTNLAGLAFSVFNVGMEFDLGEHLALNIPVYYSGWDYKKTLNMFKGIIVQPELRYYITKNKGLFAGVHVGASWYNLTSGGDYRYQNTGWHRPTYGGGIGIGYRLSLGRNSGWKMEFAVGGGVYDAEYDKFFNEENGPYAARKVRKLYYGLDQASIGLTYSFNMRRGGRR